MKNIETTKMKKKVTRQSYGGADRSPATTWNREREKGQKDTEIPDRKKKNCLSKEKKKNENKKKQQRISMRKINENELESGEENSANRRSVVDALSFLFVSS